MNKNIFYTIFLTSERVLGLFLTLVLVRYISPDEYVIWAQNLAITAIGFQFLLFGSNESIVKYFPKWSDHLNIQGNILLLIISASIFPIIIFTLIQILIPEQLTELFYGQMHKKEYLVILLVSIAIEAYFNLIIDLFRSKDQILKSSIYKFIFNFIRVGILILAIAFFEFDFYKSLVIYSTFIVLFTMILFLLEFRYLIFTPINFSKNFDNFKKILSFGIPTMFSSFVLFFLIYFDRFILAKYLDSEALSSYILNSNIALSASFFGNLVGFALFPALSNESKIKKSYQSVDTFIRYLSFFFWIFLPFIVMIYYFYPYFFYLYGSVEYLIDKTVMIMLVVGYGLYGLYLIMSYPIYVHKGSKFSIKASFLGMICNVALNLLLIPKYQMYGAAISLLISFFTIIFYTKYVSNTCFRWQFPWKNFLYILLRILILLIPLLIFKANKDNFLMALGVFTFAIFLYLFIDYVSNRSFLKGIFFEKK